MAMKIVFTKDSPLNTTLVDGASGAVMYEIETGRGFLSKTTVIRKPFTSASLFGPRLCFSTYPSSGLSSDRRGQSVPRTSTEVAKIQWKTWSSDRIVYYGHDMRRSAFMPKAVFSE